MLKECWCVGLKQERFARGWGELSEIPFRRVEQKIEEGKQRFKKEWGNQVKGGGEGAE